MRPQTTFLTSISAAKALMSGGIDGFHGPAYGFEFIEDKELEKVLRRNPDGFCPHFSYDLVKEESINERGESWAEHVPECARSLGNA
jgi:hypothetical protein